MALQYNIIVVKLCHLLKLQFVYSIHLKSLKKKSGFLLIEITGSFLRAQSEENLSRLFFLFEIAKKSDKFTQKINPLKITFMTKLHENCESSSQESFVLKM